MADLEIDVPSLEGKLSSLNSIKSGQVNSLVNSFETGYLNKLNSTNIAGLTNIIKEPINRLKKGYENSSTWFSSYLDDLNNVENGLSNFTGKEVKAPTTFTGKFEDIFSKVTMPVLKTGGNPLANYIGGENYNIGDLDMTNYPTGSSREDGIKRAVLVAQYLIKNGGFTPIQAAAMVGVYLDENNCNPGDVMQAEKNGKGAAGTGGSGYGAGIGSWTFTDFKKQCLKDAGYSTNTKIESLTLQQQCDMIIATSQKSQRKYYDALKRCDTIEDASATAVLITGGVGYSKNWDTHPTQAEAKNLADFYGKSNDARFGKSSYHWNLDKRRLNYSEQIYKLLSS